MIEYPSRLNLARLPTPVTLLKRFALQNSPARIWIKRDEQTGTEVSGNKIRKLEFSLAEARDQGCNVIITCGGVQSNHCRATAVLGARLGFKVHLILRGEQPEVAEGNLLIDYLAGATVDYLSHKDWKTHTEYSRSLQERYAAEGDKAFFIPIGASDEIGLWGYIAACEELAADFERYEFQPDYIVCATGSGGTQGGLVVGSALFDLPGEVAAFNVSDDANYFEQKIHEDVTLWQQRYKTGISVGELSIRTIEGYLGPGYGIAEPPVFELIAKLGREEGIFLDPVYTGKAFYGMVQELEKGDAGQLPGARDVLFIHTGGLFGVFPQRASFHFD